MPYWQLSISALITLDNSSALISHLANFRKQNPDAKIGFVPTMGALHQGHISLIAKAKEENQLVVCSIFVNPTQFNDPKDLERYPRTAEADSKLLTENGCDILYFPSVSDIYPKGLNESFEMDFGGIDKVMEGAHRPGHFKGVAQVVDRFFQIVQPDRAYFGQKDFQQVAVIRQLVKEKNHSIEIVPCSTLRSAEGLALSSRNMLLSTEEKEQALIIYKTLLFGQKWIKETADLNNLKEKMTVFFKSGKLELEYLELANPENLQPVKSTDDPVHCFVAAFCGKVRLIDNMRLN